MDDAETPGVGPRASSWGGGVPTQYLPAARKRRGTSRVDQCAVVGLDICESATACARSTLMAGTKIVLTKQFTYRGLAEEFSNVYAFHGDSPGAQGDWDVLVMDVI